MRRLFALQPDALFAYFELTARKAYNQTTVYVLFYIRYEEILGMTSDTRQDTSAVERHFSRRFQVALVGEGALVGLLGGGVVTLYRLSLSYAEKEMRDITRYPEHLRRPPCQMGAAYLRIRYTANKCRGHRSPECPVVSSFACKVYRGRSCRLRRSFNGSRRSIRAVRWHVR